MVLNYLLLKNCNEIERAERLGINIPEQKFLKRSLVCDINDISHARITRERNIEIAINGDYFLIEYSKYIWELIVNAINEREERK